MNKQVIIGVGIAALVLVGLIAFTSNRQPTSQVASQTNQANNQNPAEDNSGAMMTQDDKMTADGDAMMSGGDKMTADGDAMMKADGDAMMAKTGNYKTYSESTIDSEFSAGNKVVLFFHAPWCPFCKTADTAFSTRTSEIPSGVTVLKTDYDSSGELKKKYGVTYQHTFVQIDASGNMITKWNGGDIDSLIKNIK